MPSRQSTGPTTLHEKLQSSDDKTIGHNTEVSSRSVHEDSNTPSSPTTAKVGVLTILQQKLLKWGLEINGIEPVPSDNRINKNSNQIFFLWFSATFNVLAFGGGTAGPAYYGLSLTTSIIVIVVVNVIICAFPAFFAIFGPKLGMRGMIQARFSWGLYAGAIPSIFNVFSTQAYLIINCITAGQMLATISTRLSQTVGIVIVAVLTFVCPFFGYTFLHWFETFSWIPSFIAFPILLGLGAKQLSSSTLPDVHPATPSQIISFASVVAAGNLSWCTFAPDYGVYYDRDISRRIFWLTYLGILGPALAWYILGAAFAAAAPNIPSWNAAFDEGNNIGGLVKAIMSPAGGFSKFLIVLLALSTCNASVLCMYTCGLSAMAIAPLFARVPRYVTALLSEAILIPLAIIGAKKFLDTLVDILNVIGYWSSAFAAIVLTEHVIFRKCQWANYDLTQWNRGGLLPPGIAAVMAFACAFGIIVPCMSQTWYTGPVAKAGSGDIGAFAGGIVASMSYAAFRAMEKHIWPGR